MADEVSRLSCLERRRLGLTPIGVIAATRRLAKDGQINGGMSSEEICELVATEIMLQNTPAWAEAPEIDWDAILAFVEKLIPIIMALIALF